MACCKTCWTAQERPPQQTLPTSLPSPRYVPYPSGAAGEGAGGGTLGWGWGWVGGGGACLITKHAGQRIEHAAADTANLLLASCQEKILGHKGAGGIWAGGAGGGEWVIGLMCQGRS